MLKAYEFFDTARSNSIRAWLLAITRNAFISRLRRKSAASPTSEGDAGLEAIATDAPDPLSTLIHRSNVAGLRDAIESLPLEYREVLILREMEDLSYKEIASVIQSPIGTVMSRLARARARLAAALCAGSDGEAR
jgi:RNA polymerase sigma-70 factor (ECF subfamily)